MTHQYPSLYAAFDLYPSSKGAATHIYYFSQTLFQTYKGGLLYVLGNELLPKWQQEDTVNIRRFNSSIPNYLDRANQYGASLQQLVRQQQNLQLVHIRDIWSALAVLDANRNYPVLFEVNALPSIELPYHYQLPQTLLDKIIQLESFCLKEADQIVVPSKVIEKYVLEKRQVEQQKIKVITNGTNIPASLPKPPEAPEKYIIYFGALQTWQGVDDLLKAFAGLQDWEDLYLVICCSNKQRYAKPFLKLAEKLGIGDKIIWHYQLSKVKLHNWVQHALLSVAPLKANSRNIEQGCSPLKIFESMACGTAVVASNLAVTREIITDGQTGHLVRPERPAELSVAIRYLLEETAHRKAIEENALALISIQHLWKHKQKDLSFTYLSLTNT